MPNLKTIAHCYAAKRRSTAAPPGEGRWFTRVEVDPLAALKGGSVTALSRSDRAMGLHIDGSYADAPQKLVVFQMIRDDPAGGETSLATASDVAAGLDAETLKLLGDPVFPFAACDPILEGTGRDRSIRCYRQQILRGLQDGPPLSDAHAAAMPTLDPALANPRRLYRGHLAPGDVLFLNNRRVLHGRARLAPDRKRLMLRYRMHPPALGASA